MEEVFSINSQSYAKNASPALSLSPEVRTAYMRGQKIAVIDIMPLEYNPATQMLYVNKEIEVTLTFSSPSTSAIAEVGIFNNVAANTLLNYSSTGATASVNDCAFENETRGIGNVSRMRITNASQADNIQADYLIICSNALYNHPEVTRIANHRAWYNGFDVVILNVEDVISNNVGFYYEGQAQIPPDTTYKKEQHIRTCIRRIYEGANAGHTGDGKLGYVLLVGDTETGNTGMPTSFDMHLASGSNSVEDGATDFYFSCVTHNEGTYDLFGDLYIGRFCVPNNLQDSALYNVVQKTIFSETEFSGMEWKKNVLLGLGDELGGAAIMEPWIAYASSVIQNQQLIDIAYYRYDGEYYPASRLFRKDFIDAINAGVGLCDMYCHGGYYHWGTGGMYHDTLIAMLDNADKLPFCVSYSCLTGYFDGKYCFAEKVSNYSAEKGFSAMLAASRTIWQRTPREGYYGTILEAIYKNLSHVAGEFILEIKMKTSASSSPYSKSHSYLCNLFGDPALNIMADGFEVTTCLALDNNVSISSPVTIKSGGCLIMPPNSILTLNSRGTLTIESGARLVLQDGAKINMTPNPEGNQKIIINRGGIVESTNGAIEGVAVESATAALSNISFRNVDFIQTNNYRTNAVIDSCSFTNCDIQLDNASGTTTFSNTSFNQTDVTAAAPSLEVTPAITKFTNSAFYRSYLNASNHDLRIAGCSFENGSDVETVHCIVKIENSNFTRSAVAVTKPLLAIWYPIGAPTLSAHVSGCTFTNCGYGSEAFNPDPSSEARRTGAITLIRMPEFNIFNNTFYNDMVIGAGSVRRGEAIYLNNSGTGSSGMQFIQENDMSGFESGILTYGSSAYIINNSIYENKHGLRLLNNSSISMSGSNYSQYGWQLVSDNDSYEIYATTFPYYFKYNQIVDNTYGGLTDKLIYMEGRFLISTRFDATYNYWGMYNTAPVPDAMFYPAGLFTYLPVWTPTNIIPINTSGAGTLFQEGEDYFSVGDYTAAQSSFTGVIEDYPESEYATAALHRLYALEQYLDNDYASLRDYYRTTDYIAADSMLFATADYLATRCDLQAGNWQESVDWYEARIANPPSYPDSIFAVIDLEEIHMELAEEQGHAKSAPAVSYSLPQHVLATKAEFFSHRQELLALLPKEEKAVQEDEVGMAESQEGAIHAIYPNPTEGVATIGYEIKTAAPVELRLYNQLGQLLQVIPEGIRQPGTYSAGITLPELPGGIYYCTLLVNGQKTATQKLIVK